MEYSNQTNETRNCVLKTIILQCPTSQVLNGQINHWICKGYQPVFNTFQDTVYEGTYRNRLMKTIIMALTQETTTSFPGDHELRIENEKLKAKLEVALKQLDHVRAQYVTDQYSKNPLNDTKIYTSRELFVNGKSGDVIKGKNGSKLRVAIHKETREVFKKVEENWTDEGHAKFTELFPDGKDVVMKKKEKKKKKLTE